MRLKAQVAVVRGNEFTVVGELTEDGLKHYQEIITKTTRFFASEDIYRLALRGYEEFLECLDLHAEGYEQDSRMDWERIHAIVLDIQGRLMTLLFLTRALLDHWEYRLKRQNGQASRQVDAFKQACSEAYDGHFGYRFLYKLRNYAQHCTLPIDNLALSSFVDKHGQVRNRLSLTFTRDNLLEEAELWGSLWRELKGMPERLDVAPLVEEMMTCLKCIRERVLSEQIVDLVEPAKEMLRLESIGRELGGKACLMTVSDGNEADQLSMKLEWFPDHIAKYIIELASST